MGTRADYSLFSRRFITLCREGAVRTEIERPRAANFARSDLCAVSSGDGTSGNLMIVPRVMTGSLPLTIAHSSSKTYPLSRQFWCSDRQYTRICLQPVQIDSVDGARLVMVVQWLWCRPFA